MKNKSFLISTLAITLLIGVTVSCKKGNDATSQTDALENTTWLFAKEIQFYPNDKLEIVTRNSIWTFSGNHKIKIFNPDSFLAEERGEWVRTADNKVILSLHRDNWDYTHTYKIITGLETFMRLDVEGIVIESTN